MRRAGCLCNDVRWSIEGALQYMSHCHCSRCRKVHGTAFATFVGGQASAFTLEGSDSVATYQPERGSGRAFCRRCGSAVPGNPFQGTVFLPAGNFEGDLDVRPKAHLFVGSKAPWFTVPEDGLPRFDAYPPEFGVPALDALPFIDPPGKVRGSCFCGAVAFVLEAPPKGARHCHCSRCRRARSAAHASNLFAAAEAVRFTHGEELITEYKIPEARFFTQAFCRTCGSPMPRIDRSRGIAVIPMGCLDDDPGVRPDCHIFTQSKASWFTIADSLPQYPEGPPSP